MTVIVSDFDGTITKIDSLYGFFEKYADISWLDVEKLWKEGKISSKECLIKEFELVDGLCEKLIDEYIRTIEIDEGFVEFIAFCKESNIDFMIASDGADYFINKILKKYNLNNIKLITNHGEFINNKFMLTFPNDNPLCKNDSGTCKCKVIKDLRAKYDKIYYIGDGTSDLCVANKPDMLFAKASLLEYCKENKIKHIPFNTFYDIIEYFQAQKTY